MTRRTCIDCGCVIEGSRSRCLEHAAVVERARQARQPYRAAYDGAVYRANRRTAIADAGDRCTAIVDGRRCGAAATEVNHRLPLASARSLVEALDLCGLWNLEAVCADHNPRGQG